MSKPEDLFQQAIEHLEAGDELPAIQRGLPTSDQAALSFVADLRAADLPQRDPKVVSAQREDIVALYKKEGQIHAQERPRFLNLFKDWRLPVVLSAAVFALLICGVLSMIGIGVFFIPDRQVAAPDLPIIREVQKTVSPETAEDEGMLAFLGTDEASLLAFQGVVEVQSGENWSIVRDNTILTADTRLRTGSFSSATLIFKDGSLAQIGPDSELTIERISADPQAKTRDIILVQWLGESQHDVVPLVTGAPNYRVNTPAASGSVQGTEFHVRVLPEQTSWYVDAGAVEVSGQESAVQVEAGEMTTVLQDEEPATPVQFFAGQGEVASIGENWIIGDQTYQTHTTTIVIGNPQVGDLVFYEGHFEEDETRVVDLILLIRRNPANTFSLTGEVQAMGETEWTVNGQAIMITDLTEIDEGVVVGDLVSVAGVILADGSLQAEKIQRLEDLPGIPFDFTGVVQEIGAQAWLVSGVPVAVDENTQIDEGLQVGDTVRVQGWTLEDGTWLASSIVYYLDENSAFEFVGELESINPWLVSGLPFEVRAWTEIDADLVLGDLVRVSGQILPDGTWVAAEIRRYDETLSTVLIGRVFSMDPWVVSGIELNVDANTIIEGEITVGMLVRVELELLPDGTHLVLRIEPLEGVDWDLGCQFLIVKVISIEDGQIQLEGWPSLPLGEDIQIEGELQPGSIVQIMICYDEDMEVVVVYIIILSPPESPPPGDDDEKVTVCHKPNSKNPRTIVIARSALSAHLAHGDTVGACP